LLIRHWDIDPEAKYLLDQLADPLAALHRGPESHVRQGTAH